MSLGFFFSFLNMYEKQNSLQDEVTTVLSECLSTSLFRRFVENMDTYNSTYVDVLAQMIMYYSNIQRLSFQTVEYLIPELVGFRPKERDPFDSCDTSGTLVVVSNPGLARFLFTSPNFDLVRNVSTNKRKRFDDIFNKKQEPWDRTSVGALTQNLSVYQKQQILETLCKLLVVANHVSHHLVLSLLSKDLDYQHSKPSSFFNLERLITNEQSGTIRDFLKR